MQTCNVLRFYFLNPLCYEKIKAKTFGGNYLGIYLLIFPPLGMPSSTANKLYFIFWNFKESSYLCRPKNRSDQFFF
jgi:hypothetical protein